MDKKKLQQQQQEKQQQTEDGGVGEPLECELRDFEEMRRKVCFVDWLVGVFVDVHWTGGRVGEIDRECLPLIGPPKKNSPPYTYTHANNTIPSAIDKPTTRRSTPRRRGSSSSGTRF